MDTHAQIHIKKQVSGQTISMNSKYHQKRERETTLEPVYWLGQFLVMNMISISQLMINLTEHKYNNTEIVDGQFGGAYSLNKFSIRVLWSVLNWIKSSGWSDMILLIIFFETETLAPCEIIRCKSSPAFGVKCSVFKVDRPIRKYSPTRAE